MITVTASAHCLRCDWTAGPGDPVAVDKAAERHVRTEKHTVGTIAEPAAEVATSGA
jgi:hypothetical protein